MSKPWCAFFKRVAVYDVGVSALLALVSFSAVAAPSVSPSPSLPARSVVLSSRGGQSLRVGDTVAYTLEGGDAATEARWGIDSAQGGLKLGFLFRPGRLFTPLAPGELTLPSLPILDENGQVVAKSDPVSITIASNFSDKEKSAGQPQKPEPALGPIGLPYPPWIQSAIAFTLLALALIGGYFILRFIRRRAAAALKKILPKKPYDVASLDRLDSLLKQGFIEKGTFKPLYFGISETVKFYLGERFDFDAQESTTSELLALLRERGGMPGLNESVIRRIQDLFEALDPVKFADQVPSAGEAKAMHQTARDLILSTRKIVVEPVLKEAR